MAIPPLPGQRDASLGTVVFFGREMKGTEELGGMKMASEGVICSVLGS